MEAESTYARAAAGAHPEAGSLRKQTVRAEGSSAERFFHRPTAWWDAPAGIVIGFATAVALFLSVPLTQSLGVDPPERRQFEEARVVINTPEVEELPDEPEPPKKEDELELAETAEAPQLSLDQLDIALNVGTDGAVVGDFGLPAAMGAGSMEVDPEEFVDFANLDRIPMPIGVSGFNFPNRLKRRAVEGRIVLLLRLSSTGEVISAEVESSDLPQFDDFIRNEVESWRFTPPTQKGRPVNAHARLPIPIRIG